jgi:formate-dependent nitrite reductase membrane component NrfD
MLEEVLITARANPKIDPVLGIWSWEIPVYLFLGGLTAGIMFFAALMILLKKEDEAPFAAKKLALWAPIALSIGMGALFLDLEHKLYMFRFYTSFQPTSPMSWGAWILVVIYPVSLLLILATFREGYPTLAAYVDRFGIGRWITDFSERHRQTIAKWNLPFAVALGIYTGILLSAFSARPFWNTGVLGPLFLVSGLSSAAALAVMGSKLTAERHLFSKVDIGLIVLEIIIVTLLIINLSTGGGVQREASALILGGEFTVMFWAFFVVLGLLIPLTLEFWEMKGGKSWVFLAPVLVLFGGYMLRQVTVQLGQTSTWTNYATQFNPELLQLLK